MNVPPVAIRKKTGVWIASYDSVIGNGWSNLISNKSPASSNEKVRKASCKLYDSP